MLRKAWESKKHRKVTSFNCWKKNNRPRQRFKAQLFTIDSTSSVPLPKIVTQSSATYVNKYSRGKMPNFISMLRSAALIILIRDRGKHHQPWQNLSSTALQKSKLPPPDPSLPPPSSQTMPLPFRWNSNKNNTVHSATVCTLKHLLECTLFTLPQVRRCQKGQTSVIDYYYK